MISVAVYLANVAVAFGLVEQVAGLSTYLTGPANLPDDVGTAILTTTVSTFKRSIPFQYGIWGAEFGMKVIIVNTVLKIVFIFLTVVTLLAI